MANELYAAVGVTGLTIDVYVYSPSGGTVWSTVSLDFLATTAEAWENYAISLLEQDDIASDPTGVYVGSFPFEITDAGAYPVVYRRRTGLNPDPADPIVGTGTVEWSGQVSAGAGNVRLANAVEHGGTTARLRLGAVGSGHALHLTADSADVFRVECTSGFSTDAAVRFVGGGAMGISVTGAMGSVAANLTGKILGSGSGTITGVGARSDLREWMGSTPNALSSGRVDTTVGAMQSNVITAAALATDAGAEIASAWGTRVVGTDPNDGPITADMLLSGQYLPDFTQNEAGTSLTTKTIAGADALTKTFSRLSTNIGGIRSAT